MDKQGSPEIAVINSLKGDDSPRVWRSEDCMPLGHRRRTVVRREHHSASRGANITGACE